MSDDFPLNSIGQSRRELSFIRKAVFTVFLTILVIGFTTLLGEILVRGYYCWLFDSTIFLTELFREHDSLAHRASENPILGYELKPDFKGRYYRRQPNPKTGKMENRMTEINTNAFGFRDKPYSKRKPPNTFRILVIGDSITFGLGVPQKQTFSQQLENLLNKTGASLRFEVLNSGVTGYNAYQEIEFFITRGIRLFPDLIIINYAMNDQGSGDNGMLWYFNRRNKFLLKYILLKKYRKYFGGPSKKAIRKKTKAKVTISGVPKKFRFTLVGNAVKRHSKSRLEIFSAALRRVEKVCLSREAKSLMVIFPYSDKLPEHPLREVHQNIRIIAEENGFSVVDLWDTFKNYPAQELYLENVHPNEKGFQVAAQAVCNYLVENRMVPVFPEMQVVNQ